MTYRVHIAEPARRAIRRAAKWIAERSPGTASRWLDRLSVAIYSLDSMPMKWGLAPESRDFDEPIRQLLFGRAHRRYRVLFVIHGDIVHVVHFRHWAQGAMPPSRVILPRRTEDSN